jgi:ABC-type sulfate transport system permease component
MLYLLIMLFWGAMRSVMPGAEGRMHFNNFVRAFADISVLNALKNTLLICTFVRPCSFMVAVPLVWVVTRTNVPGTKILET